MKNVVVVEAVDLNIIGKAEARGLDLGLKDFAGCAHVLLDEIVGDAFYAVEFDDHERSAGTDCGVKAG